MVEKFDSTIQQLDEHSEMAWKLQDNDMVLRRRGMRASFTKGPSVYSSSLSADSIGPRDSMVLDSADCAGKAEPMNAICAVDMALLAAWSRSTLKQKSQPDRLDWSCIHCSFTCPSLCNYFSMQTSFGLGQAFNLCRAYCCHRLFSSCSKLCPSAVCVGRDIVPYPLSLVRCYHVAQSWASPAEIHHQVGLMTHDSMHWSCRLRHQNNHISTYVPADTSLLNEAALACCRLRRGTRHNGVRCMVFVNPETSSHAGSAGHVSVLLNLTQSFCKHQCKAGKHMCKCFNMLQLLSHSIVA